MSAVRCGGNEEASMSTGRAGVKVIGVDYTKQVVSIHKEQRDVGVIVTHVPFGNVAYIEFENEGKTVLPSDSSSRFEGAKEPN